LEVRDLSVLSDLEFEELAADLLSAELDTPVERFGRGRDGGIDLRWTVPPDGAVWIGQCKHYCNSTFPQLKAAAVEEAKKVAKLMPAGYYFITSLDLLPQQKDKLIEVLSPAVDGPVTVLGARDIDGLLTRHQAVEQRQPKLWLTTGTQLFWATHADIANRTLALKADIAEALPLYVTTSTFDTAQDLLRKHRVCVIAGHPGIGKTTLAHMLVADAISDGFEPIEVSADIEEAWTAYRAGTKQVFLYDDFLGELSFAERMGRNEDKRLADLIKLIQSSKTALLVMATREYILQDARRQYPRVAALDQRTHFVLELGHYSREDRARILYNHLWHSGLPETALAEISASGFTEIIDHPGYSPRLIEFCTGPAFDLTSPGYPARFLENLEHPDALWRTGFEEHLNTEQQLVAIAMASLPRRVSVAHLEQAHRSLCATRGIVTSAASFRSALKVLDDSFLATDASEGERTVEFDNPSVRAFVLDWLGHDRQLVADLLESAVFFEQPTQLFRYSDGRVTRSGRSEPQSTALRDTVVGLAAEVRDSHMRLIDSPSAQRSREWWSDDPTPMSSAEDRMLEVLKIPAEFRPQVRWLNERAVALTDRWERNEGHKGRALDALDAMEQFATDDGERLDPAVVEAAADALDGWLPAKLKETDEDWLPYTARLRDKHVALDELEELAQEFEEFVDQEIARWSPSPPHLHELEDLSREFGLPHVTERIVAQISEDQARAESEFEEEERKTRVTVRRDDIGDDDLAAMFSRLTDRPTSADS
jgi:hypothetical protein